MTKAEALIEGITQGIIAFIVEDKAIDYDDAMNIFYNSQIFEKLTDESTGLYLESPVYIWIIERRIGIRTHCTEGNIGCNIKEQQRSPADTVGFFFRINRIMQIRICGD